MKKAQALRRALAQQELKSPRPLGWRAGRDVGAPGYYEFCAPRCTNWSIRSLRLGKYPIDARLDLHKLTADQARQEVYQFIKDCAWPTRCARL